MELRINKIKALYNESDNLRKTSVTSSNGIAKIRAQLNNDIQRIDDSLIGNIIAVATNAKDLQYLIDELSKQKQLALALNVLSDKEKEISETLTCKLRVVLHKAECESKYLVNDVLSGEVNVDSVKLLLNEFSSTLKPIQVDELNKALVEPGLSAA